jgi:D-amino-acid dehydrogenase
MALFKELSGVEQADPGLKRNGILDVFRDRLEFDRAVQAARLLRQYGVDNRVLGRDDARDMCPALSHRIAGGVFYPEDGHLEPERFVRGLARRAEDDGVVIHTQTEVIGIGKRGRRITGVQTTRGDFKANDVVLAGGAWSPRIARDIGLKLLCQPAKGYSVTYKRPPDFPELPVILVEARVAVTPMDAALRFAGTLELAGWDQTINQRRVNAFLRRVAWYLADVDPASLELIEIWRGLRPCTPDGLPYVGRPAGIDNLLVATGHGMNGISLAPITGKLIAAMAAGKPTGIDLSALRIERFRSFLSRSPTCEANSTMNTNTIANPFLADFRD